MNKEEKAEIIKELAEKFDSNSCFYIADASGLTVEQTNIFRRACFNAGIEYGVYKNTLIRKALEKAGVDNKELFDSLKGFSGVLFSGDAASLPARVIADYRRTVENKPRLKAASIYSDVCFGDESLDGLTKLKSKEELLGNIVSALLAPMGNVVSALVGSGRTLAGIIKTLEQKDRT